MTTSTGPAPPSPVSPTYRLDRSDAETRRLVLQHQIYGPLTRRLLVAAGITVGMRVLDLGSGAGDVALAAGRARRPDRRGRGTDLDPAVLEVARARAAPPGWSRSRSSASTSSSSTVPAGRTSTSTPSPGAGSSCTWRTRSARSSGRLRAVRSGGIVVAQESDYGSPRLADPPAPLHTWLTERLPAPPGPSDLDPGVGFGLHRAFLRAGLPAPHLRFEAPVGGGPDWPGYHYLAETVRSILPHLERAGLGRPAEIDVETLADRLRADIVERDGVQILPPVVGAWART